MSVVAERRPEHDPLAEVLAGDQAAIRRFYREYGPLLLEVIRRVLRRQGRVDEGEDCLQAMFLELFSDSGRALRRWRPELGRSLRTYLCVLANYRSRAWLRRRTALVMTDEELRRIAEHSQAVVLSQFECIEFDELATQLEARCSKEEWRMFGLLFLEDREPEEISRLLGMNVATVYQRKHRLRQRVEDILTELDHGK